MAAGDGQDPVYEMFWDCEYCGAEKLLGKTHRHCPSCGAVQNPESRYFPPEEEKVAVQDHVYFGADWKCENCGTPNSNRAEFCGNCGSGKDGTSRVDLAHEREAKEEAEAAKRAAAQQEAQGDSGGGWGMRGLLLMGCLGIMGLGLIVMCGLAMFGNSSDTATIASHSWSRSITVEEYKAASDGDWCDDIPSKAYDVRKKKKEKDTKRVKDGETCTTKNVDNGDGTFKQVEECKPKYREEPVFAEWCDYTIDKWDTVNTADAGGADMSPRWPEPRIKTCTGSTRKGCQREGKRTDSYFVQVRDSGGDTHECSVSEARWRALKDGASVEVEKNMLTGLDCSSL